MAMARAVGLLTLVLLLAAVRAGNTILRNTDASIQYGCPQAVQCNAWQVLGGQHVTAGPAAALSFVFGGTAIALVGSFVGSGFAGVVSIDGRAAPLRAGVGGVLFEAGGLDPAAVYSLALTFERTGPTQSLGPPQAHTRRAVFLTGLAVDYFNITQAPPAAFSSPVVSSASSATGTPAATAPAAVPTTGSPAQATTPGQSSVNSAVTPSGAAASSSSAQPSASSQSQSAATAGETQTGSGGVTPGALAGSGVGTTAGDGGTGSASSSAGASASASKPRAPAGAIAGVVLGVLAVAGLCIVALRRAQRARARRMNPSRLVMLESARGQRPVFSAHGGATWTQFAHAEGEQGYE